MKKLNKEEIMDNSDFTKVMNKYRPSYNLIEPIEDCIIELYEAFKKDK